MQHPPVAPVFFAFRIMVGIGILMLGVSWVAAYGLWRRDRLHPWVGRALVAMTFSGWVATLSGWYVTEIGRQPWLVTGVLQTADAASEVPAIMIGTTLAAYLMVYAGLIAAYIGTIAYITGKAMRGDPVAPSHKDRGPIVVPAE